MYALTAAEEALTDAKWKPSTQEQLERTGTGTTEQSSVKPKCRDNTECVMKVAYCKIQLRIVFVKKKISVEIILNV